MNQKDLERIRIKNLSRLDNAFRIKINAVEIDINNSIEHEFAKVVCVWMIRKGIPAERMANCVDFKAKPCMDVHMKEINKAVEDLRVKFKHEWERPQIVTEARLKNKRKPDILILDTGEMIEIETNPKVEKEGVITVRI